MAKPAKSFYKSFTFWLGALTLSISIATFLQGEQWVVSNPYVVAGIGTFIGVATIVLRFLTDRPIKLR